MAKGCIVASVLPLYLYFSVLFLFAFFSDEPEVFLLNTHKQQYFISAHFRRAVNT